MTAVHSSHLVLGGARSGKSRHAVEQAAQSGGRVAFLATARALDGDMAARIARHRAERPARLDHAGGAAGSRGRLPARRHHP